MNYSIKVNKLENKDWSTKAFVSIVFEESLKVTDITVKKAKNGELFVAMPEKCWKDLRGRCRRQMENGYSNAGSSEKACCYECK